MFKQAESVIIENPEALKLFRNLDLSKYLQPFFADPCTLTRASTILNIDMSSYYYWIKKFLKLGLLVISHETKRAGSSIKYYITPAKTIILKFESKLSSLRQYYDFANRDYHEEIIYNFIAAVESLNEDLGLSLGLNKHAEMNIKPVLIDKKNVGIGQALLADNSPAAYAVWKHIPLKYHDAKELQRKLAALINEYEQKAVKEQRGHLIQVAIVPEK